MKEEAKIAVVGNGVDTSYRALHPDMVEKEIELHYARKLHYPMAVMANAIASSFLSKSENKVAGMSDLEILRHYEQIKLKASKLSSGERRLITRRAEKIINQNPL